MTQQDDDMMAAAGWERLPDAPNGHRQYSMEVRLDVDHRSVECPACSSKPGELCTAPTVDGQRPVQWVHNARRDLAEGWT